MLPPLLLFFFFFNDTATTEIYTLSLHDALPIFRIVDDFSAHGVGKAEPPARAAVSPTTVRNQPFQMPGRRVQKPRSEEHTSELQSRLHLVCRLLLEKKKIKDLMLHSTST